MLSEDITISPLRNGSISADSFLLSEGDFVKRSKKTAEKSEKKHVWKRMGKGRENLHTSEACLFPEEEEEGRRRRRRRSRRRRRRRAPFRQVFAEVCRERDIRRISCRGLY
jgi:hypothetical protein